MISICIPVLKRYDLLNELLDSLSKSVVRPDVVHILDNGRCDKELRPVVNAHQLSIKVFTPTKRMGLAESWNWFINNVPEERVITNDDIQFAPESLGAMLIAKAPFVSCSFGFSCFILRDECIERVGLFDEMISPGYAYFEDMDYLRRMKMAGVLDDVVRCGVVHRQSATPQRYTDEEWNEHHRRFSLAQDNYEMKWQGKPSWNQLAAIGGQGAHVD